MITGLYNVIIASQCIIYYIIDNYYVRCQDPILPLKIPVSKQNSTDNLGNRLLRPRLCCGGVCRTVCIVHLLIVSLDGSVREIE